MIYGARVSVCLSVCVLQMDRRFAERARPGALLYIDQQPTDRHHQHIRRLIMITNDHHLLDHARIPSVCHYSVETDCCSSFLTNYGRPGPSYLPMPKISGCFRYTVKNSLYQLSTNFETVRLHISYIRSCQCVILFFKNLMLSDTFVFS